MLSLWIGGAAVSSITPTPTPLQVVDIHDGAPKRRESYRKKKEKLRRQLADAVDALPVEQAKASILVERVERAVQIIARQTEHVAVRGLGDDNDNDDDELAIVIALL